MAGPALAPSPTTRNYNAGTVRSSGGLSRIQWAAESNTIGEPPSDHSDANGGGIAHPHSNDAYARFRIPQRRGLLIWGDLRGAADARSFLPDWTFPTSRPMRY